MARQIRIDQIADLMGEEVQEVVKLTALSWAGQVKEQTPVDTGRLRNAWQTKIDKLQAEITNNMEYAEPVLWKQLAIILGWPIPHTARHGCWLS